MVSVPRTLTTLNALVFLSTASRAASVHQAPTNASLPIVDLGYEHHQAISLDETGGFYNFSNIRYGAAPVGSLRFREPVEPEDSGTNEVNDGSVGRVCPQSSGNWSIISAKFGAYYLAGDASALPYSTLLSKLPTTPLGITYDPRTTEDCLFLDVIAPKAGFDGGNGTLPVLIWVTGGGYTAGEKTGYGKFNPASMLKLANNGFIFVSINYRLGAFGFLGGDEVAANGTPNAGLYDQRLAFKWVQKYIHLFGGDPDRVTVMGGSAGAGSIMHQIAAYGGDAPEGKLFQQAIIESPAFLPSPTDATPQASFADLMAMLNVSSLAELRDVESETLIAANALQIYSHASYGSNMYGPYVDGTLVPALPGKSLLKGDFNKDLKILVTHNTLEGLNFTNPTISTDGDYNNLLAGTEPTVSNSKLEIVNALYPPIYNGSIFGYGDEFQRAMVTVQDVTIVCNTRYLESAMADRAYGIQFAVPPGTHGEETDYLFHQGGDDAVATRLQQYVVSFVMNGEPSTAEGAVLPLYGASARITQMNTTGDSTIRDDAANLRCAFWQVGL